MKITNISLRLNKGNANSSTLAWAKVDIDNNLIIDSIVFLKNDDSTGYKIILPNYHGKGKARNYVQFKDKTFENQLLEDIVEQYELLSNTTK